MPGFTEEITIRKPNWEKRPDNTRYVASYTEYPGVWADRVGRSGALQSGEESAITEYDVIFRCRTFDDIREIGPGWRVVDWHGDSFDVVRVNPVGTFNVPISRINRIDIECRRPESSRRVT